MSIFKKSDEDKLSEIYKKIEELQRRVESLEKIKSCDNVKVIYPEVSLESLAIHKKEYIIKEIENLKNKLFEDFTHRYSERYSEIGNYRRVRLEALSEKEAHEICSRILYLLSFTFPEIQYIVLSYYIDHIFNLIRIAKSDYLRDFGSEPGYLTISWVNPEDFGRNNWNTVESLGEVFINYQVNNHILLLGFLDFTTLKNNPVLALNIGEVINALVATGSFDKIKELLSNISFKFSNIKKITVIHNAEYVSYEYEFPFLKYFPIFLVKAPIYIFPGDKIEVRVEKYNQDPCELIPIAIKVVKVQDLIF